MTKELVQAHAAVKTSEEVKAKVLELVRRVEEASWRMEQIMLSEPKPKDDP